MSGAKFPKNKLCGVLIADHFVEIAETGSASQSLIDIVHTHM